MAESRISRIKRLIKTLLYKCLELGCSFVHVQEVITRGLDLNLRTQSIHGICDD